MEFTLILNALERVSEEEARSAEREAKRWR